MDNWLVQGIIQNTVWALLVLACGLLVAWMRTQGQKYANSVLYGLAAAVLMLFIIVEGRALLAPSNPLPVIPKEKEVAEAPKQTEDLSVQIRSLVDGGKYTTRLLDPAPGEEFKIGADGDTKFTITQYKARKNELTIRSILEATPQLKALSNKKQQKLIGTLNIDLALLGIQFATVYEGRDVEHRTIAWFQLINEIPADNPMMDSRILDGVFLIKRARTLIEERSKLVLGEPPGP